MFVCTERARFEVGGRGHKVAELEHKVGERETVSTCQAAQRTTVGSEEKDTVVQLGSLRNRYKLG